MASQRDYETRTNVVVQFIPCELDELAVQDLISKFGPVKSMKLKSDGQSENFCIFTFYEYQDARAAIDYLDGLEVLGRILKVSYIENFKVAVEHRQNIDEEGTNLLINYLPVSMTMKELLSFFAPIGELQKCRLMIDLATGEPLSYGFVKYHQPEDAAKAINQLNGLKVQHKTLKVSYARPCSEQNKGINLYVGNLPKSMHQEDVRRLFLSYGQVITCRLVYDHLTGRQYSNSRGISKGFAFVLYNKRSEAEMAIRMLDGASHRGNILIVKFAKHCGRAPQLRLPQPQLRRQRQPQLPPHQPQLLPPNQQQPNYPQTPVNVPIYQPPQMAYSWQVVQVWTIFVCGLGRRANEAVVLQQFRRFGYVQSVRIFQETRSRLYGFVEMIDHGEALNAVQSLDGSVFQGRPLQVRLCGRYTQIQANENLTF